jgi:hypothetical protein
MNNGTHASRTSNDAFVSVPGDPVVVVDDTEQDRRVHYHLLCRRSVSTLEAISCFYVKVNNFEYFVSECFCFEKKETKGKMRTSLVRCNSYNNMHACLFYLRYDGASNLG